MPPPQSKKKKKKSSKSTAKEVARVSGPNTNSLEHLEFQAFQLSNEWEASPQKKALTRQIREQIIPQKSILLNDAVCLGLGTLQKAGLEPLPGCTNIVNQGSSTAENASQAMKPVAKGKARNMRLYQLLVFETVIACLREKFSINVIRFQDPSFTKTDQDFLERRGHIVIAWNSSGPSINHLDHQLLEFLSPSTFCYLPYLDLNIVVKVIHMAKPRLYLGYDLVGSTVQHNMLRHPKCKPLMEEYSRIVLAYDFAPVAAFTREGTDSIIDETFGFMWQANLKDVDIRQRIQTRNSRILEKEKLLWLKMDQNLEKKKAIKNGKAENGAQDIIPS